MEQQSDGLESLELPHTNTDQKLVSTLASELDQQSNNVAQEGPVLMSDFKWCDAATALMLKLYREKQVKFNNPHVKKKVIWREIAEIMQQNGYAFDADRCERKFLNLKTSYRNTIQHNCMTGNMSRSCAFFAVLHEIFQMQISMEENKSPINLQPSPVRLVPNSNNVQVVPVSEGKETRPTVMSPSSENVTFRATSTSQQPSAPTQSSYISSEQEKRSAVPTLVLPNSSPNSQFQLAASMFLEASTHRKGPNEKQPPQYHGQPKIIDNHGEKPLPVVNIYKSGNPPVSPQVISPHENGRHHKTAVVDLCNERKRSTSEDESRAERVKRRRTNDLQTLLASFEKYREEQKSREDDRMRMMKEFHDEEMKVMNRYLDIIQQCVQHSSDD